MTGFRIFSFSVLLNVVLFSGFFAIATPCFDTNDDLIMQWIASGFLTGEPSEYLVFTNVILGLALQLLYRVSTGNNWYLSYLLFCHFVCFTGLAYVILRRRPEKLFVLLFVVFFAFVEGKILLSPQFTTTAFLCGMAGVLLLMDSLEFRRQSLEALFGVVLIGLMVLIREPVSILLLIVAGPFIAERLLQVGLRKILRPAVVMLVLTAGFIAFNSWYCRSNPRWAEYLEYNSLRGKIHSTPLERFTLKEATAIGWTENDARLFLACYYNDTEVFGSVPRMRLLLSRLKEAATCGNAARLRFTTSELYLPKLFEGESGVMMSGALLIGLLCAVVKGPQRGRVLLVLVITYGASTALSVYLSSRARLPERIACNIPILIATLAFYWASEPRAASPLLANGNRRGNTRWLNGPMRVHIRGVLMGFLALALVHVLSTLAGLYSHTNFLNAGSRAAFGGKLFEGIERFLPEGRTATLVLLPAGGLMERAMFFEASQRNAALAIVPSGWVAHSPVFEQVLERNRLVPYSLSILNRNDVFLLMDVSLVPLLETFYKERYGLAVQFEQLSAMEPSVPQMYGHCRVGLFVAKTVGDYRSAPEL